MKIRLKNELGSFWETTIEAILEGEFPVNIAGGPKIIGYDLFACTAKDGTDIFVGDRVLVKGTKRIGEYETEVTIRYNCVVLSENKTYLIDSYAISAILKKI